MKYSELQSRIKEIEKKAEKDIEGLKTQYLVESHLKIGSIIKVGDSNYKIDKFLEYDLNAFFGICIVYRIELLKKDLTPLKNPKFEKYSYYPYFKAKGKENNGKIKL